MTVEKLEIDVPKVATSTENMVCAQCEHQPHASVSEPSLLREVLRLKQGPRRCTVLEHDSSGWGAHPCQCADPIHA